MSNVWCIRAKAGEFTDHFLHGNYVAIGWCEIEENLFGVRPRDDLDSIVQAA